MIQWKTSQFSHPNCDDDQTDRLMMEKQFGFDVLTVGVDDSDDVHMELFGAAPATPHHNIADKDLQHQSQSTPEKLARTPEKTRLTSTLSPKRPTRDQPRPIAQTSARRRPRRTRSARRVPQRARKKTKKHDDGKTAEKDGDLNR